MTPFGSGQDQERPTGVTGGLVARITSFGPRPARADEHSAIARLIRRSKAEAMPWLGRPHTLEEDEAWVAGSLLPEHSVTVVDVDGSLSAVLATSPGWVDQLYVDVGAQGRGIGSALLLLAMAEAKSPLRLWTFQRNLRARRFYENHGFVVERSTTGDNEEREPDVLYSWSQQVAAACSSA